MILDGLKRIHFDKQGPFEPSNPMERHLWELDLARLEAVEVYDLDRDPGERENLAVGSAAEASTTLAELLDRRRQEAARALAATGLDREETTTEATDEARRRLQALGYLGR